MNRLLPVPQEHYARIPSVFGAKKVFFPLQISTQVIGKKYG
jgi:hypothetical protein